MTDSDLKHGPCVVCEMTDDDPDWVTRIPCERCGRVVCHKCADTGVYGSAPDFEHFVTGAFNHRPYHLPFDSCPFCKTMDWMEKHGGPRRVT